ncbi:class I SAM-dependent methyltransferase [Halovivax limisalsi]|uniref:class I SAM-dependent methyltransferase n=1 Tax=Halovivax limisalsi TaxID=1453760 RepID=UPI001FFCEBEC|nr:class I SAM-dependent methyltransferase [Halovivax limisalsi]
MTTNANDGSDERDARGDRDDTDARDDTIEQRRQVREGYDELATAYADERDQDPDELALVEELFDRIDEQAPRVLDAGCGDGRAASRPLAELGAGVVGLDVSRSQLELASETFDEVGAERADGNVPERVQGDLTGLPFETDSFDGICALHSIIHVPTGEHEAVLAEFARVLDAGGWLLLTTGTGAWEGENPDWLDGGAAMRWSFHDAAWTRETLEAVGFTVADARTIGDELGGGEWRYLLARRE